MRPRIPRSLLRLISRLGLASGRPWMQLLRAAVTFIRRLATHPQVAELLRFIFLGTIVETGRQVAAKVADFAKDSEFFEIIARNQRLGSITRSFRGMPNILYLHKFNCCSGQGGISNGRFRL